MVRRTQLAGGSLRLRPLLSAIVCLPLALVVVACANSVVIAEALPEADASAIPSSGFTPAAPDGGDAGDFSPEPAQLCIATECPVPYATCGAGFRCGTNLSNDNANCGACGNTCADMPFFGLQSRCVAGVCRYECIDAELRDCNGLIDDGCEVNIKGDPANCGTCGNTCAPGQHCINGLCGCPTGLTDCDGVCVDLLNDKGNCSACGNVCPSYQAAGWPAPPKNMQYTCAGGQCGKLTCSGYFRDCDGDESNGCETNISNDPKNCAHCHNECDPGQVCSITGGSSMPRCLCDPGLTLCGGGTSGLQYGCADLVSDVKNCGACGYACPTTKAPNVTATCDQGVCATKCIPGFADCDGNPSNGCEVNLMIDGSNCGACGQWCSAGEGQPCVEGRCLMKECAPGEVH